MTFFSVGCLAPDFDGATIPDMAEEGQAPFEMGAVVNFQCLDGQEIKVITIYYLATILVTITILITNWLQYFIFGSRSQI